MGEKISSAYVVGHMLSSTAAARKSGGTKNSLWSFLSPVDQHFLAPTVSPRVLRRYFLL